MEAISNATATISQASVVATTIAQASENVGQGEPMEADHWFRQVSKVLEAMEISFDATRIKLDAF